MSHQYTSPKFPYKPFENHANSHPKSRSATMDIVTTLAEHEQIIHTQHEPQGFPHRMEGKVQNYPEVSSPLQPGYDGL